MKRSLTRRALVVAIAGVGFLAAAGFLYSFVRGPSRPAFRFLADREPDYCHKWDHKGTKSAVYIYSFPAEFDDLCEAARTELTALRFEESPDSATPDSVHEFTRSVRTDFIVTLQVAKLDDDSTEGRIVYGHEPGWVCVEIIQTRKRLSWRQELHYCWRRLTP